MTHTIQLSPRDTLPSLLARIKAEGRERLLFVVPPELSLTVPELQALRREASVRLAGLALVSDQPDLRRRAAEAGISTYRSIEHGQRARWRRLRSEPWPRRRDLRPPGMAVAEAPPAPGLYARRVPGAARAGVFLRAFVRRRSPWWATLGLMVIMVLLLGGLSFVLAMILPEAHATLVPASEPFEITVPLQALASQEQPDAAAGLVPAHAESVQVTGQAQIATTGREFEPTTKATGEVVFVNRTGSEVAIPSGTVVSTATGDNVGFITTSDGKVEAGGRTVLPIEAQAAGVDGNVPAGTITAVDGSLALYLYVSNESDTTGGGSAEVAVVTDDDKSRLQDQLFQQLKQQAYERLTERLAAGAFVPADSVSYLAMSPTFTPFVGDVSPQLSLSMSVQAVGLVVDTTSGDGVALQRLEMAMPPGSRLVADSVHYIPGSVSASRCKARSCALSTRPGREIPSLG
jgi:hypothetical protein